MLCIIDAHEQIPIDGKSIILNLKQFFYDVVNSTN